MLFERIELTIVWIVIIGIMLTNALHAQVINAGEDTTICYGQTVSLNAVLTKPIEEYDSVIFTSDDIVLNRIFDIGFPFNFFEDTYTEFVIASNGWISFSKELAGAYDDFHAIGAIPSTDPLVPKNAIMFPWQDWYPYNEGELAYVGFARISDPPPYRFVINFFNVKLGGSNIRGTFQLKLFYLSNEIEVHITSKPFSIFNGNIATIGVHNKTGDYACTPPGRNGESWEVNQNQGEAWKFIRQGSTGYVVSPTTFNPDIIGESGPIKWYQGSLGNHIGTGKSINVTPLNTTTYIAEIWLNDAVQYTDAVTVYVNPLPVADAGDDIFITSGNPVTLDGSKSYGVPPLTYHWQSADGSWSFTDKNPQVQVDPPPTITTEYILQVTDANGCISEVNTEEAHVIVRVNNADLFVKLSANDATICKGDEVVLTAQILDGYPKYECTWEAIPPVEGWKPNPDEYIQNVYPIEKTLFCLTVTDQAGMVKTACVTINVISVQPEIKGETEVCEQETGVIYTTDPTGNHFSWSMNGLVPGDITPLPGDYMLAVDFGAGSGTNTINVIETTSDTYQCTGTASLTVTIHPKPNPMIDDSKGNPVCQWATGVPYSVAWNQDHSYTWNISSQYGNFVDNDSTHHEVKVNWIDSGEAGLTLTEETKFGCINTAYTTITINPAPTPEIMGPDAICEDETTIHTTQNYPDHSYVWDTLSPFPGDVLTNLLTNQITVSWKRAGAAQMTVKETIDDTKCSAVSMPFTTVVNARPKLSLLAETLSVCQGDSVFVELDGGDEYLWLEGQHISWIPETSSWWLFPDEAMHYLVQGTLAATGCADTLSWNVDIRPYPIIDLGGDQYIEPGETITLDAGEGFDQYLWNTGSTGQTLDVTSAGLYEVRVGLKNCEAQDSVRIKMPVSLLPIPNAFSPNSDGENDTFGLIGYPEEITWFNMQIFNRWGAKIFETTDPFQHWDGTYQGILCDTGTYLWIISLEEKSLGQSITKRGYVTLLR